jgi:hypothetical protein
VAMLYRVLHPLPEKQNTVRKGRPNRVVTIGENQKNSGRHDAQVERKGAS